MSMLYKTRIGNMEVYNNCVKCGKYLKHKDCKLFINGNDEIKTAGKFK